jgi:predicted aspartyl protease
MPTHNQFIRDQNKEPSPIGLRELGAYLPIEIHVRQQIADTMVKAGLAIPTPIPGVGLIDTGATQSCVDESILTTLQLNPIGVVNCGTANGPVQQSVYPARIVFPTKGWTSEMDVIGVNLAGQFVRENPPKPIIALLGRNFLELGTFFYNGTGGFWTLSIL